MENNSRPLILVCNDDGIFARGLKELVMAVLPLGEVVVVAPDKPQSGKGHSITLDMPLWYRRSNIFGPDVLAFKCTGSPADCVKISLYKILSRKPDIILSGINHGSNSSINQLYSGTMGAAIEGALHNIPSVGFSILNFAADADFSDVASYVQMITATVMQHKRDNNICLNVNIPNPSETPINGIKFTRMSRAMWDEYYEENIHPNNRKMYYWLCGKFINHEPDAQDTDECALSKGYISICPVKVDYTDYQLLNELSEWNFQRPVDGPTFMYESTNSSNSARETD